MLVPGRSFCDEVRFTNLFRGETRGLSFAVAGKISAVDPLEYDSAGEPGGGVESWLPGFNDSVDIRRNHEDLAVPVPLSNADGPELDKRFRALDDARSAASGSSCSLSGCVDAELSAPPLTLFDGDSGWPSELRF